MNQWKDNVPVALVLKVWNSKFEAVNRFIFTLLVVIVVSMPFLGLSLGLAVRLFRWMLR